MHTHTNLKQVICTIFNQEIYRDLLYLCKQYSSFYSFNNMRYCNIKLSTCFRITSTKCHINAVVPFDDGHGEVQNMKRL